MADSIILLVIIVAIVFVVKSKKGFGMEFHKDDDYYYKTPFNERLKKWAGKQTRDVIVFDTETSGLDRGKSSIVSISAIRCGWQEGKLVEKERYSRFYFPEGVIERKAIQINGLTADEIEKRRSGARYAKLFRKDRHSFLKFCKGTNLFAAYNIDFDAAFAKLSPKNTRWFCVMRNSMAVLNYGSYPKLKEAAEKFGIPVKETQTHDSMYDTELCLAVLNKILETKIKKDTNIIY
jgi:DNA polymerase III epsilon subunit-like protein